ncbi:PAS domain-containing hybrid sensor histidine kinase/response regulator [Flavivirga eckloniae]|uniref:histidine kinase n=1 Tax=Flavivirga eckloniae TaxID=1803846 RepID=A0A2K9PWB5_9FLAO|nr:PAS domain-containing hybrid sensor histidine kinase/response regulator [Flavivirga eckloniae]AUP81354.1 hypothetical protein C1H87_22585 [Flavivirga eckloniae]
MKRLFVYCSSNFEDLLQLLQEFNSVTYCYFSEIELLKTAIKQKKPDALLLKGVEFSDAILNCIFTNKANHQIPIIISGKFNIPKTPTLQVYSLPDKFNKTELLKLFTKLNLVNKNLVLFQSILEKLDHKEQYIGNTEALQFIYKNKIPIRNNNGEIVMQMEVVEHTKNEIKRDTLEESLHFFNLLMDNIPDAIYFKDRASKFIKVNHVQAVALGVDTTEQAVGKCDADFFGLNQCKEAFNDEQALMDSGIPLINKLEVIDTSKGKKYVKATKVPLMDTNGNCIGLFGISRDITKEYNEVEELRKEKGFLDLLMNNMPSRIYFKDKNSRFIRSNMALAKLFGLCSPEEMYGKTDFDFFGPVHAKEAFEDEQNIIREGTPILNKLESFFKHGQRFWEMTTKIPFFNNQNEVMGIVGITNDFTEQKKLGEKLEKEQELLQVLMDNVPDLIYFKDADLKYIRVNKAFSKFFKVGMDEVIGMTDSDLLDKVTAKEIQEEDLEIVVNGSEIINKVEKLKFQNKKTIWFSSTKVPIKFDNSQATGLVGISRDVTLQEQTKQRLLEAKKKAEAANKAKSLFLANMSHEIRTPMNGIIGMADILGKSKLKPIQAEYLDIIMKSGQTLLALINDILDFSKIETGKMELEIIPVNIRNVIEEVADIHVVHATEKSIDLLAYVDPKTPKLVGGDYIRLKQIITNLVNNAIKFTSKGEVVIHVDYIGKNKGKHEIQFKIKDSGIGVTKKDQTKIFKSFSQVDPSTTRKYGGTGLGLAISQLLVTQMGGELSLESSIKEGSTFFFTAKFHVSKATKKNNMFLGKEQLRKKHIVIVDDNETNRLIFRNYLETWQVKVSEFSSSHEALSFLKKQSFVASNPIDLVLLDYQMPYMNGKELAKRIKSDKRTSNLKLILLSSITDAISLKEMKKIGFETGLNKPIKMNQLLNVLLKVLGMQQKQKKIETPEDENHLEMYKNKRFLIVEDNLINIKVAQIVLSKLSSHVEVAKNGLEAVNLFKKNKFDVILMDIRMPVMDGIEATIKIRASEKRANIEDPVRIIALTANTFQEDIEQCMDNGMDAFLEKPFIRKDLTNILQRLL